MATRWKAFTPAEAAWRRRAEVATARPRYGRPLGTVASGLSLLPLVFALMCPMPAAAEQQKPASARVQLAEASPDAQLLAQIEARILDASASFFADLRIDVVRGDVLLTGTVSDIVYKARAAALVRSVPAVISVFDAIHVAPVFDLQEAAQDLVAEAQIRRSLRETFGARLPQVRYRVTDGIAYVFGAAATEYERNRSLAIAAQTSGVKRVINHFRIVPPTTG